MKPQQDIITLLKLQVDLSGFHVKRYKVYWWVCLKHSRNLQDFCANISPTSLNILKWFHLQKDF